MNFNFETKKAVGRGAGVKYVVMASSSARNVEGKSRQFSLYFSKEAKFITEMLGKNIAISFDYENKRIALKSDINGWSFSDRNGNAGYKEVKISRNDEWSFLQRIPLSADDISIVDGIVILDFSNLI
jgi:hypothetical protein